MTEKEIQKQIIDYLKQKGHIVFRMNSGKAQNNIRLCPPGTPDLLVATRSGHVWVEVKTSSGKLREEQVNMIQRLSAFGDRVLVARSLEDVLCL